MAPSDPLVQEVVVVGAGPTGLTLACQLRLFGVEVLVVDRCPRRRTGSPALLVHPRLLEALRPLGVTSSLVARGSSSADLQVHWHRRLSTTPLHGLGLDDTPYPFLLFVPQEDVEAILERRLVELGGGVARGVELVDLVQHDDHVSCRLTSREGRWQLRARHVVGCDGATSTVRDAARIAFPGRAYRTRLLVGDATGIGALAPGTAHSFVGRRGMALLFPLGRQPAWRAIAPLRPWPPGPVSPAGIEPAEELRRAARELSGGRVELEGLTRVRQVALSHHQARHYRAGRVFLAGDAAHVHSPAGGQGMNTGAHDAVNLGWKLALVALGWAGDDLLASYERERRPVGRTVLAFTSLAFTAEAAPGPLGTAVRTVAAPVIVPWVLGSRRLRQAMWRSVSQLRVRYRPPRATPVWTPARRRAGARLGDAPLERGGRSTSLHEVLAEPGFHVLLLGPPGSWDRSAVERLAERYRPWVHVTRLLHAHPGTGAPPDAATGDLAPGLGRRTARGPGWCLVRPDGHLAAVALGDTPDPIAASLARLLHRSGAPVGAPPP